MIYDVLDGLWFGLGRARPPAGLTACVGCNKASNRISCRQGGRCFLINIDLLAARGSPRVALEDNLHVRPFCDSRLSSGMFLAFIFGASQYFHAF